jgi:hypothetical protein
MKSFFCMVFLMINLQPAATPPQARIAAANSRSSHKAKRFQAGETETTEGAARLARAVRGRKPGMRDYNIGTGGYSRGRGGLKGCNNTV